MERQKAPVDFELEGHTGHVQPVGGQIPSVHVEVEGHTRLVKPITSNHDLLLLLFDVPRCRCIVTLNISIHQGIEKCNLVRLIVESMVDKGCWPDGDISCICYSEILSDLV